MSELPAFSLQVYDEYARLEAHCPSRTPEAKQAILYVALLNVAEQYRGYDMESQALIHTLKNL